MQYKGKDYPTRVVHHKFAGEVVFGTTSLQNALIEDGVERLSDETRWVDEQIYAYVDDEVLMSYTNEEFEAYVNRNYD